MLIQKLEHNYRFEMHNQFAPIERMVWCLVFHAIDFLKWANAIDSVY